jgi:tRNA-splicing ligase RtcB
MTFKVRETLKELGIKAELVYDVAHNIAKEETYKIDGKKEKLLVHRKGATRAFSAGNKILPEKYISTGQPVVIPGSMGTCSYVLIGDKAEGKSLGSVSHGAGRSMSRSAAKKQFDVKGVIKDLGKINVSVLSATNASIVEEAPLAYKDVNEVVDVLEQNELAKPVARMKPMFTIKG